MPHTTAELRQLWKKYECKADKMEIIPFGTDRIRVAPVTADAWTALATVLDHHGYALRNKDTDSYNCRETKEGKGRSLHAFGIALDINWHTNPYIDHGGERPVRFSPEATQAERAEDVRRGRADTDMTEAMVNDALAIRTRGGLQIFSWGGSWKSVKDCMHFELDVSPAELEQGVDWSTCAGWSDEVELEEPAAAPQDTPAQPVVPPPSYREPHVVIARDGLRLRSGPGESFGTVRSYPAGTSLYVIARESSWAQVDLEGDGIADGYMWLGFLRPSLEAELPAPGANKQVASAAGDDLARATPAKVKAMFPATPLPAISKNLPFVLDGLRKKGLTDLPMILMALATIRAETEGFVPISEGKSKYNTASTPFDRYDAGTKIGKVLGNTQPGDGARFKGRGYVQLTGRFNYSRIGKQVGQDLVGNPDLANDPGVAGLILAQFLKNVESGVRSALQAGDLAKARKLVNGGAHGLERFSDAYQKGKAAL